MKYEATARPLLSVEDLEHAIAAGARIEYTSCGNGRVPDTYDMPRSDEPRSGGWVPVSGAFARHLAADKTRRKNELLRAWYPMVENAE